MRTLAPLLVFSLVCSVYGGTIFSSIKPVCLAVHEAYGIPCSYVVKPGSDPHNFEPSLRDVLAARDARFCVAVGLGFDPWMERLCRGKEMFRLSSFAPEGVKNPHIWLDPVVMEGFVKGLSKAVGKKPREAFFSRLHEVLGRLKSEVSSLRDKRYVAVHPAWSYLSRRIGLEEVLVLFEVPSGELSYSKFKRAVELRKKGVKVLLGEVTEGKGFVESLAKRTGLEPVFLDPMGWEYDSYTEFLRCEVEKLLRALR